MRVFIRLPGDTAQRAFLSLDASTTRQGANLMSKLEPGLLAARRVAPLACQNAGDMSVLLYLGTFAKRLGSTLGIALQRLVFYLLSTGRSVVQLAVDVRRMLYRSVGWMSASPRSPMLRDLGLRFTLPRWKIFSGTCFHALLDALWCASGYPRAQRLLNLVWLRSGIDAAFGFT